MAKTWTLTQIRAIRDPDKETLVVEDEYAYILGMEPLKLKVLFKKAGNRYVQINLPNVVETIVKKLAPHVDIKKFLEELILIHSPPEEIMELKERLEKGYVKITEAPRCYSLMIGGKRGRPLEFNLVG